MQTLRNLLRAVALASFAVVGFSLIGPAPAHAQTSKAFWNLVFGGKVIRESSTLAYCKDWALKEAPKLPEVQASGPVVEMTCVERLRISGVPTGGGTPVPPEPTPSAPVGAWVTGQSAATEPTTALPARGVATPDPTFKQPVYRISDRADPPKTFARNDYSRRQAFNVDNSRQLVFSENGYWHTYNANALTYEKQLAGPAGDAEPQWHPTNRDLLHYLGTNGVGMKLYELNVATNTSRTVADFSSRLRARWPGATYAWTKSEGSPSKDSRYWCFMVDDASWGSVGVFTWDRDSDTILGYLDTKGDRPDHVSMTPSGNYCVVSGDSARGTVAYGRDFSTQKKLLPKSEHSDIALDKNGDDVFVSVDYQSNAGDVFALNIRTGERVTLFPSYLSGTARAFHFSGKGYGCPGWVLVSVYGDYGGAPKWMDRKSFFIELKAGATPYNVAWHRSVVPSYFFEPHASASRDCSRVAVTSGWGKTSTTDINTYQVRVPALP